MAYGGDYYLDYVIWTEPLPGEPYVHPIDESWDKIKGNYFGGIIGLAYDYALWKDRINIGFNFSSRYYLNNIPFQFNYRLQIGYSF